MSNVTVAIVSRWNPYQKNSVTVLAVTRSGKQYGAWKAHEDRRMKDPKVWEAQKQVRTGLLKRNSKAAERNSADRYSTKIGTESSNTEGK